MCYRCCRTSLSGVSGSKEHLREHVASCIMLFLYEHTVPDNIMYIQVFSKFAWSMFQDKYMFYL